MVRAGCDRREDYCGLIAKQKRKTESGAPEPTGHEIVNGTRKEMDLGVGKRIEYCRCERTIGGGTLWRQKIPRSRGMRLLATDCTSARDTPSDWLS